MATFVIGQRWISESEPELGLGIVESVDRHQVRLAFPASNEARLYAPANAPIRRVEFRVGDSVQAEDGRSATVETVRETEGLLTYVGDGVEIAERDLADSISFSKPEDRLINGQADQSEAFALRFEANCRQSEARHSPVAGFVGGRIDLIPHQLYIASEVARRYKPRVLLADEVGLGKTIEACLILHRLHLTGRAERALILLPESLVHQWFVELLRRFNLWFTLMDAERCESIRAGDPEANPFTEDQLVICSLATLTGDERWARCAAEADWDLTIVDEAHHLEWTPESSSAEYRLVESIAARSHGLLLLTATPEQLGAEGHFARLRLLDPERYPDLEKFLAEQAGYAEVAKVAERLSSGGALEADEVEILRGIFAEFSDEEFDGHLRDPQTLLDELVDRHGTGRVIFRNTREALKGFPERKALPVAVEPRTRLSDEELGARLKKEFDHERGEEASAEAFDFRKGPRVRWLAELLRSLGEAKVLLICRSRRKVEALHEALTDELKVNAAVFHEDLTLLQRDRNAAWFADPEGARILLCSEIGSEGRNFQFAHHLVLFDLPLNPELLEQRIGRLDRIGQSETIRVHLPYLERSWTELLFRWHHEGLDGVEHSLRGGNAYLEKFGAVLRDLGGRFHEDDPGLAGEADELIAESREFREGLEARLAAGQDRLVALNSFRPEPASEMVERIRKLDTDTSLDGFMSRIFDHFGVTVDELGDRGFHVVPEHLFTDSFPALPEEGTTLTCSRAVALGREDLDFLSWDHPMVRGAMDLMLGGGNGNSAVVVWTDESVEAPPIMLETIFVLESVAPPRLHVDRFLPPTPIRVLVDMRGADCSADFSHADLNRTTADEEAFRLQQNPELLQALVPEMIRSGRNLARERKSALLEAAVQKAHARLDGEASRLKELKKVNPNVSDEEIAIAERTIEEVTRHVARAHLRLDAVRLVLRAP